MHTYVRTYTHPYIQTYIHTYVRTYIHTYLYIHTYVRTYISVLTLVGLLFLREKFVVSFHITLRVNDTCWYVSRLATNQTGAWTIVLLFTSFALIFFIHLITYNNNLLLPIQVKWTLNTSTFHNKDKHYLVTAEILISWIPPAIKYRLFCCVIKCPWLIVAY